MLNFLNLQCNSEPGHQNISTYFANKFLSFVWEVVLTTCNDSSRGSALFTMEPICSVTVPLPTHRVKVEYAFGHLLVKWWELLNKFNASVPGTV